MSLLKGTTPPRTPVPQASRPSPAQRSPARPASGSVVRSRGAHPQPGRQAARGLRRPFSVSSFWKSHPQWNWGLRPEARWWDSGRTPKVGKDRLQGRWPLNNFGMAIGWVWGTVGPGFCLYTQGIHYMGVSQTLVSASHLPSVSSVCEPLHYFFHVFHLHIDPL